MNDPHVAALIYRVEHGDGVTWNRAEPLVDPETPEEFRLQVKDKRARFELKVHYAKESEARKAIENFIRICIPVSAFSAKGDITRGYQKMGRGGCCPERTDEINTVPVAP